jgi:hypothetical protein
MTTAHKLLSGGPSRFCTQTISPAAGAVAVEDRTSTRRCIIEHAMHEAEPAFISSKRPGDAPSDQPVRTRNDSMHDTASHTESTDRDREPHYERS